MSLLQFKTRLSEVELRQLLVRVSPDSVVLQTPIDKSDGFFQAAQWRGFVLHFGQNRFPARSSVSLSTLVSKYSSIATKAAAQYSKKAAKKKSKRKKRASRKKDGEGDADDNERPDVPENNSGDEQDGDEDNAAASEPVSLDTLRAIFDPERAVQKTPRELFDKFLELHQVRWWRR
jgi:hypothetical protein